MALIKRFCLGGFFSVFLLCLIPCASYGDPLDNWHVRNSVPGGYSLNAVTYGNGIFVAVGSQGTILSSPDGISWTARTSGTSVWLYGVTYGNSMFVVVGDGGTILTSPDGIDWIARSSGTTALFLDIAYGNGVFVAVGDIGDFGGTILTSPDGEGWTIKHSGGPYHIQRVTYADGTFIALGYGANFYVSLDGISWTSKNIAGHFNESFSGIIFRNGTYVIVGALVAVGFPPSPKVEMILTSSDGANWTQTYFAPSQRRINGITYGSGYFVAVGESGEVVTSPDGFNWTVRQSTTTEWFNNVVNGNGTFVAVGSNGVILQSDPVPGVVSVPALSGLGIMLFIIFSGLGSLHFMYKYRPKKLS